MLNSHLNAARCPQNPIPQPSYCFAHVPQASPGLAGSSLQRVQDRDQFHACMGEMLLLCKESMRRRRRRQRPLTSAEQPQQQQTAASNSSSKPLSLEYLADRIDIDDPIFGYVVRTMDNPSSSLGSSSSSSSTWKRRMLQGFITVTTFTTWQRSFRWDSTIEAAFEYDDEETCQDRLNGVRKWDSNGHLSRALQDTVRCGDIYKEGIVWPRIAEISLLGALGCGRTLVELVIEDLECLKATARANYDYLVLQATDNSIAFYESLGFVRVGAVMQDDADDGDCKRRASKSDSDEDEEVVAEPQADDSPENPNVLAVPTNLVCSETTTYRTKKAGETPHDVAKWFQVDVWDIVFLNKTMYPDVCPSSRLMVGTMLLVPKQPDSRQGQDDLPGRIANMAQWYTAKENDTPRTIARKFQVDCLKIVEANKVRLAGLMSSSRLKAGTRIKVSHFDGPDHTYKPYSHWSFPDDDFEDGEPAYMMVRKLNRRRGSAAARHRPVLSALAVPIVQYEPTDLIVPPSPHATSQLAAPVDPVGSLYSPPTSSHRTRNRPHPDRTADHRKRPVEPYVLFVAEQYESRRHALQGKSSSEVTNFLDELWGSLSDAQKSKYRAQTQDYNSRPKNHHHGLTQPQHLADPGFDFVDEIPVGELDVKSGLYNKVVRLKPGAMTEGSEYTYWYVLTYIPDLKWCHLAPLEQVGIYGADKPKACGRPKWMLVDESLGKEVDISASFCVPIKARCMKRTLDADKEEWDVIDDGSDPTDAKSDGNTFPLQRSSRSVYSTRDSLAGMVCSGKLIKPSVERKKKRSSIDLPPLAAIYTAGPSKVRVVVKLVGRCLYDEDFFYPLTVKKKRGRPKGSKNRLKSPPPSTQNINSNHRSPGPGRQEPPSEDSMVGLSPPPPSDDPPSPSGVVVYSPKMSAVSASQQAASNRKREIPKGSKNRQLHPPTVGKLEMTTAGRRPTRRSSSAAPGLSEAAGTQIITTQPSRTRSLRSYSSEGGLCRSNGTAPAAPQLGDSPVYSIRLRSKSKMETDGDRRSVSGREQKRAAAPSYPAEEDRDARNKRRRVGPS